MCPPKIEVFSQTTGIYVEIIYNPRVRNLKVKIALKRCRQSKSELKKKKRKKEKERKQEKQNDTVKTIERNSSTDTLNIPPPINETFLIPVGVWTGRLPWQVINTFPSRAKSLATTSDILHDALVTSHEGKTALNKRKAKIYRKRNEVNIKHET